MAQFVTRAARLMGGGDPGTSGGGDPGTSGGGDPGTSGGGDPGTSGGASPGSGGGGSSGPGGGGSPSPGYGGSPGPGGGAAQPRFAQKAAADLGPAIIAQRRLTFRIQHQQQSEWCWAAVAASVQQYFEPASEPTLELHQCKIASMVLQVDCCANPELQNYRGELARALQTIHKWRNTLDADPSTGATGSLTFAQVQREIDRGRPVCAGIAWKSGGVHFVVVRGYRVLASGAHQLYIADPENPSNLVDFDEFSMAYFGEGTWIETDLVMNDWS